MNQRKSSTTYFRGVEHTTI